ncbi:beta-N-acetylhexosaminidase [Virgibacillus senegalensis]|uniref:beta-N-acetylhexosaminidase n=1 Tax=Virgibacillus senegalensis TaxID=1499679 RepID=UPI00069E6498|nr:beta-N-acetylhexosaminidase [Virgibacillus senegalensis]
MKHKKYWTLLAAAFVIVFVFNIQNGEKANSIEEQVSPFPSPSPEVPNRKQQYFQDHSHKRPFKMEIKPKPYPDPQQGLFDTGQDSTQLHQKPVSSLLEQMSLQEKIGQMVMAGVAGLKMEEQEKRLIEDYHIGGFIFYAKNLETPDQISGLLNKLKAENRQNKLPLLLSVDQEGGRISRLPGNISKLPTNALIGKWNEPDFSFQVGQLLGTGLTTFGFNMNFAPVLDVNSNPDNPVIGDRSFGSNPEIVSELGIQTMKGIQSKQVIPVIKHFPGHGDTSVDSHYQLPVVDKSLSQLEKIELIPFRKAMEQGAEAIMIAHILLPNLDETHPASLSKEIISNLLRKRLNFEGVVMTDDMTMAAITDNYDIGRAAVDSVLAGSDIILVAHDYQKITHVIKEISKAVEKGVLSEGRINESVERIIRMKQQYQLEDKHVKNAGITELNQSVDNLLKKWNKEGVR